MDINWGFGQCTSLYKPTTLTCARYWNFPSNLTFTEAQNRLKITGRDRITDVYLQATWTQDNKLHWGSWGRVPDPPPPHHHHHLNDSRLQHSLRPNSQIYGTAHFSSPFPCDMSSHQLWNQSCWPPCQVWLRRSLVRSHGRCLETWR